MYDHGGYTMKICHVAGTGFPSPSREGQRKDHSDSKESLYNQGFSGGGLQIGSMQDLTKIGITVNMK